MLKFQRWIFCINNHKFINSFESQSVKRLVWNNIDKIARPLLCCDGTNIIFAYLYTFYVIIEFRLWAVINICITAITHLVERAKKLQNTAKLFRPGSNTCTIFLADSSRSSGGGTSSQLRWLSLPFSACHTHATSARAYRSNSSAFISLLYRIYHTHPSSAPNFRGNKYTPHTHTYTYSSPLHTLCVYTTAKPQHFYHTHSLPSSFFRLLYFPPLLSLSRQRLPVASIYIYSVRGLSCGIGAAASLPSTTSSSPERARESERAQRAASAQSSASGAPSAGYARSQRRAPVSKRGEENGEERWWKVTRERERGRSGFAAPEQRPIGQFLAGSSRTRSA